jgi:hypothetical protein
MIISIKNLLPNKWALIIVSVLLSTLFVLQSSQDVSSTKLAYGVTLISIWMYSVYEVRLPRVFELPTAASIAMLLSTMFLIYVFVKLLFEGLEVESVRSSLPYLMFGFSAFIGIAAGLRLRSHYIQVVIILVGLLSSALLFADWAGRRGAFETLTKAGLSSSLLPALAFSMSFWWAVSSKKHSFRTALLVISATIASFMIATGSRSNLTILAAFSPIALLFVRRKLLDNKIHSHQKTYLLLSVTSLFVLICVSVWIFFQFGLGDFLTIRIVSLVQGFLTDSSYDQSFIIRNESYQIGNQLFESSPIVGLGFIKAIQYSVFDTPFNGLIKIGVLGYIPFVGILIAGVSFIFQSRKFITSEFMGILGWLCILLAQVPFGTAIEDKGLSLALILIFALATSTWIEAKCPENVGSNHLKRTEDEK